MQLTLPITLTGPGRSPLKSPVLPATLGRNQTVPKGPGEPTANGRLWRPFSPWQELPPTFLSAPSSPARPYGLGGTQENPWFPGDEEGPTSGQDLSAKGESFNRKRLLNTP